MTLETIQFPFGDRELPFSHPAEEAEMIISVLGGEDSPEFVGAAVGAAEISQSTLLENTVT